MEKLNYEVGDIVKLKKQHPCRSEEHTSELQSH